MIRKVIVGLALVLSGHGFAAIVYPTAPEGGREVVYKSLRPMVSGVPAELGVARAEDLTVAEPYRCYTVGVTNLAAGELLSAAKAGAWQYRLTREGTIVGALDLVADDSAEKGLGMGALHRTNFAKEILEAAQKAGQLAQVKKRDYELRRLEVPGLSFVAVWLHGKSDDIFLPLPPTDGRKLTAYEDYSEGQIVKVLKAEAQGVMKGIRSVR